MVSILTGVVLEWVKLVPFLLIAFLVVEFVEHKASDKMRSLLSKSGRFGSVAGSALGAIPQCGFSVMAANLYYGRVITPGTLVAVFISTSDEAVPVLIANGLYSKTLQLILIKVMIGIVAGLLVDFILVKPLRINHPCDHRHDLEHLCSDCGCKDGIIKSAIYHTIKISLFILAFILVFNLAVHFIGEENFSKIILSDSIFQPLVTALIGFVPGCASSEILAQLYVQGGVSGGGLLAGLCTNTGIAIAILFKVNKNLKENFKILAIMYFVAIVSGIIYQCISTI